MKPCHLVRVNLGHHDHGFDTKKWQPQLNHQIFDDITALFSCTDVPLVHEVVPMLTQLEERLENVRDAPDLLKVIRITAIASLLVVEKYSKLSDLSEVYRIAMGTNFVFP